MARIIAIRSMQKHILTAISILFIYMVMNFYINHSKYITNDAVINQHQIGIYLPHYNYSLPELVHQCQCLLYYTVLKPQMIDKHMSHLYSQNMTHDLKQTRFTNFYSRKNTISIIYWISPNKH
eukprot:424795_1